MGPHWFNVVFLAVAVLSIAGAWIGWSEIGMSKRSILGDILLYVSTVAVGGLGVWAIVSGWAISSVFGALFSICSISFGATFVLIKIRDKMRRKELAWLDLTWFLSALVLIFLVIINTAAQIGQFI